MVLGAAGLAGRGQSCLVGTGFRHVPFLALRLPVPKLLAAISWIPFPMGACHPSLTLGGGGTGQPELVRAYFSNKILKARQI